MQTAEPPVRPQHWTPTLTPETQHQTLKTEDMNQGGGSLRLAGKRRKHWPAPLHLLGWGGEASEGSQPMEPRFPSQDRARIAGDPHRARAPRAGGPAWWALGGSRRLAWAGEGGRSPQRLPSPQPRAPSPDSRPRPPRPAGLGHLRPQRGWKTLGPLSLRREVTGLRLPLH